MSLDQLSTLSPNLNSVWGSDAAFQSYSAHADELNMTEDELTMGEDEFNMRADELNMDLGAVQPSG